ncbi:hypothetical protein ACFVXA_02415 [Streptomyces sp. NPDC058246]|uniref:hypothetical protein n=1 Tax=unclassified Streptomyces TaxID=2593676 RepID=UPI0034052ABB
MPDEQVGIQATEVELIPATRTVAEVPAAADARDALLQAISQEARNVADKSQGQASTALEQLARAYALVVSGYAPTASIPGAGAEPVRLQSRAEWGID